MVGHRIPLRVVAPASFPGHHVEQDGPIQIPDQCQLIHQSLHVVPIHRTVILEAQFPKDRPGGQETVLDGIPDPRECRFQVLPDGWDQRQETRQFLLRLPVDGRGTDAVEVVGERPDVRGDRHLIVVENDEQVLLENAGIVDGLNGNSGRHGSVADHADDAPVPPHDIIAGHDAEPGRDGGSRVARQEGVIVAFFGVGEAGEPAVLAHGVYLVLPSRQNLVRVALVPHVPEQPVFKEVEGVVQSYRQFRRAEIRGEVAAFL